MSDVVRVVALADGQPSRHTGRYVVAWDPHTKAGALSLTSSHDLARAKRFDRATAQAFKEWTTVSRVQPRRPWDGMPNTPLCILSVEILDEAVVGTPADVPLTGAVQWPR